MTETILLTRENVRASLDKALAERGADYVYTPPTSGADCQYLTYECQYLTYEPMPEDRREFEGDQDFDRPTGAGCIVGFVLTDLGVPLKALAPHEGKGATGVLDKLHRSDVVEFPNNDELDIATALLRAQQRQDDGQPWSEAVESFDTYYSEVVGA